MSIFREMLFLLERRLSIFRGPMKVLTKLWRYRKDVRSTLSDLALTRKSTKLFRLAAPPSNGKVLSLYALDDDSIYSIKLMAFASQALRIEGWHIRVIFRDRSTILGRAYFKAYGINDFIYLTDQKLDRNELALCRRQANHFLDQRLNLGSLKNWTFEGCWVGPQLVSTLSRDLYEGSVDFNDPRVRRALKRVLLPTLEHVIKAKKFNKIHPSDLALTIEANYAMFGPLVDAAINAKCDVIQMVQPWKDDALTFRRLTPATRREHPSSVSSKTLDRLTRHAWADREQEVLDKIFKDRYEGRWFLQERNQRRTRPYSDIEITKRFKLDPGKPVAVIFSQVLWDANLFYGDDLFEDAGKWLIETVAAACKNPEVNWLVKLHPANVWKREHEGVTKKYTEHVLIDQAVGKLPAHVQLIDASDDISTLSLFRALDYGITIRGTAGLELVCFGKPCITAGTGRYSGLGFTIDSDSPDEYLERLANLHKQPLLSKEQWDRAKWHAFAAFKLRPWPMLGATASFHTRDHGEKKELVQNLELNVNTVQELVDLGNLKSLAEWAQGKEVDYLNDLDGELNFEGCPFKPY